VAGALVTVVLVYSAVRMAVTDALRNTLDPSLLTPEPESKFRLDEGDAVDDVAPAGGQ
jgi:hypothetical protein